MTPEIKNALDNLQLVANYCALASLPLADHQRCGAAIQAIAAALSPAPVVEPAIAPGTEIKAEATAKKKEAA